MAVNPKKSSVDTARTADKEYLLHQDLEYSFYLSGSGTWQVWDGTAWLDYEESFGTSQAFRAFPPPSGRVQLAVTSGTVTAGFRAIRPGGNPRMGG